ncbi:MAG: phospho-N-acetylmuramoyl-pentapeptide-transferase [Kiritimatiellae bacterium]|nr:phospho-N-acetylmuramoyl-pentapeptide-transferase [Kiritimatiellia bacterium]
MLYSISRLLTPHWGPFRLLSSHALLLAGGTFCAALLVVLALPHLWNRLPRDRGKVVGNEKMGESAKGKPTGAGFFVALLALPVILLFAPLAPWDAMTVLAIYAAMVFGYMDDAAAVPWGELKKGLLDLAVSLAAAYFIFMGHSDPVEGCSTRQMLVWLPFFTGSVQGGLYISPWIYVPVAAFVLWFTMNATNCSDGVDGLAGSLTVITLVILAVILYVVVGYRPVAHYFLIPVYAEAARWAIVVMIAAGAFGGYLWFNAEPSRILMGDAGSRFLGMLVAAATLMTGNPLLVLALSPIVLVNGGGGMGKLVLLRTAKRLGFEIGEDAAIRKVRFPLHDHCKKKLGWSNAQVLMRFILLQLIVMPILLIALLKIR